MLRIRLPLLAFAATALSASPLLAQRAKLLPAAHVETMELSGNLPTSGTLGGLSVDADGNLYVANFLKRIYRVSPAGKVTLLNGSFVTASGNSIAPDGRLMQSDFGLNRVYAVDTETGSRTVLLNRGLNGPVGVVMAPDGNLFVANCNGQTIKVGTPGIKQASNFASSSLFNCPNGLVLAPTGDLFAINFFDNNLLRIDPAGTVTLFATLGTQNLGGGHIAFINDTLYVSMFNSHAVYSVTLGGKIELVAGKEGAPGLSDGAMPHARLRYPNGIAADPGGRFLYTNNLEGPRNGSSPGRQRIRRLLLP